MITDTILKSIDNNYIAQLLSIDLSSVFDKCIHTILFIRLADIDISPNSRQFIKSYLENEELFYIN